MIDRARLQIPQGTEGFYIDEAIGHRSVQRTVEDRCALWGYHPVQTPVFDYFDLYQPLLSANAQARVYRLFDREGDVLMLRSDVTLFLARQVGLMADNSELPLRVQYGGAIFRHQDALEISGNEFYQMGAELVGADGAQADAEIILLHFEVLEALDVSNARCHIGSRAMLPESADSAPLREAISIRDWQRAATILGQSGLGDEQTQATLQLCRFIGSADGFARELERHAAALSRQQRRAAEHLLRVAELIDVDDSLLEIDLSEVGTQSYHSGIVFQTYLPALHTAVASGGRYDKLLSHFGLDAPSVGFSVMTRMLQHTRPTKSARQAPAGARGEEFAARLADARRRREEGEEVIL